MEVPAHADDRPVVLLRDRVVPADAVALLRLAIRAVGSAGVLREDADLALVLVRVLAVATLDVEDRIERQRPRLHVEPERDDYLDAFRLSRLGRRVVDGGGDVDVLPD